MLYENVIYAYQFYWGSINLFDKFDKGKAKTGLPGFWEQFLGVGEGDQWSEGVFPFLR